MSLAQSPPDTFAPELPASGGVLTPQVRCTDPLSELESASEKHWGVLGGAVLPSSRMVTGIGETAAREMAKRWAGDSHQVEESGFHEVGVGPAALGGGDGEKVASPSSGRRS